MEEILELKECLLNHQYEDDWQEHIEAVSPDAIFKAADEAFGGIEIKALKSLLNLNTLQNNALELLNLTYTLDGDTMVETICDRFQIGSLLFENN